MDGQRFDSMVRALAQASSRRHFVRGLAAGAAGGLLGLAGLRDAAGQLCREAGRACTKDANCCGPATCDPVGKLCVCPPGTANCRGACKTAADYLSDVDNCGECGHRCPVDQCNKATCTNGVCGVAPNPHRIGKGCNDGDNCTVDDVCQANGACRGNAKNCSALSDQCNDGACDRATGSCVARPKQNGTDCNADNSFCTQNDTCQNGRCTPGTPVVCAPVDACHEAGTCDPATGVCSSPLKPDNTPCGTDQICCGGVCRDLFDPTNCGSCGNVCPETWPGSFVICDRTSGADQQFAAVGCIYVCNDGFQDCDGIVANGCETNIRNDPDNCRFCGNECAEGQICNQCVCEAPGGAPVGRICQGIRTARLIR